MLELILEMKLAKTKQKTNQQKEMKFATCLHIVHGNAI